MSGSNRHPAAEAAAEAAAIVSPTAWAAWGRWFWPAWVTVLIADQASKWWLHAQIDADGLVPHSWPDWLLWHYNTGIAWSLFDHLPGMVLVLTLALIPVLALVWWRVYRSAGAAANAGFGMVLGGAVGNLIDRVLASTGLFPGVRDFIHVDLGFWPLNPWPTFNIADAGLCVGFAVIYLATIRSVPATVAKDA
jgi:signal peptidase II